LAIAHPEKPGLDPVEDFKTYQAMVDVLPNCAVEISEWWRKKRVVSMQGTSQSHFGTVCLVGPKITPNAWCP
jgi:hypothetical protein